MSLHTLTRSKQYESDTVELVTQSSITVVNDLTPFLDSIVQLDELIASVKQSIIHLDSCQHSFLNQPLSGDKSHHLLDDLRNQYHSAKQKLNDIGQQIRELEVTAGRTITHESNDRNIARNQLINVGRKYRDVVVLFRDIEQTHSQRLREYMSRQLRIVKPDISSETINQLLDEAINDQGQPVIQVFAQQVIHSSRYSSAQLALRDVQDRQTALSDIARQVDELSQLFIDVSLLIDQQDSRIDTIFAEADNTATELVKGAVQVEKARQLRRRQIKLLWGICILLVLVITGIVLWALFGTTFGDRILQGRKNDNNNNNNRPSSST